MTGNFHSWDTLPAAIERWLQEDARQDLPEVRAAVASIEVASHDFRRHWVDLVQRGRASLAASDDDLTADVQVHRDIEHNFARTVGMLTSMAITPGSLRPGWVATSEDAGALLSGVDLHRISETSEIRWSRATDQRTVLAEVVRVVEGLRQEMARTDVILHQGIVSSEHVDAHRRLGGHVPLASMLTVARVQKDLTFAIWLGHLVARKDVVRARLAMLHRELGTHLLRAGGRSFDVGRDGGLATRIGSAFADGLVRWHRHFRPAPEVESWEPKIWAFAVAEAIDRLGPQYGPLIDAEGTVAGGSSIGSVDRASSGWFSEHPAAFDDWMLGSQKLRNALWASAREQSDVSMFQADLRERVMSGLDRCATYLGEWTMHRLMLDDSIESDPVLWAHVQLWGDCAASIATSRTSFPMPLMGMVAPLSEREGIRPIHPLIRGVQLGVAGAPPPVAYELSELVFDLSEVLFRRHAVVFDVRERVTAYLRETLVGSGHDVETRGMGAGELRHVLGERLSQDVLSQHDRVVCELSLARLDILDLRLDELSAWLTDAILRSGDSVEATERSPLNPVSEVGSRVLHQLDGIQQAGQSRIDLSILLQVVEVEAARSGRYADAVRLADVLCRTEDHEPEPGPESAWHGPYDGEWKQ